MIWKLNFNFVYSAERSYSITQPNTTTNIGQFSNKIRNYSKCVCWCVSKTLTEEKFVCAVIVYCMYEGSECIGCEEKIIDQRKSDAWLQFYQNLSGYNRLWSTRKFNETFKTVFNLIKTSAVIGWLLRSFCLTLNSIERHCDMAVLPLDITFPRNQFTKNRIDQSINLV